MAKASRSSSTGAPQPGVLTQTISLPQPSGVEEPETDQPLSFWEKLYTVPEDDWWSGTHGDKGWKVYLYEDIPGSPYLAVIAHPFDIEWLRQEYGGGSYKCILNDPTGRMSAQIKFRIDGDARRKPPQSTTAAPAPAPHQDAVTSLVEMIREEQRATREMLREVMSRDRQAGPASAAEMQMQLIPTIVGGVVKMFSEMIPRQQSNPLDDLIKMKQLLGEPTDVFKQISQLKELGLIGGGGGGVHGLLGELDVVLKVAERVGITPGGGGRSIPEILMDKGPEILREFRSGIAEYRQLEEKRLETAKVVANINRPPQQPATVSAVTYPPAGSGAQPAAVPPQFPATHAPTATPLTVEPIGTGQSIPVSSDMTGQQVAQLTEDQLHAIKIKVVQAIIQGNSGDDIVGFLAVEAPAVLNGFVGVPADQVAMFFRADPVLSQAAKSPRFLQTLQEMVEIVNDIDGEGPDTQIN